jgi:dTDP-4-amino-4,6-dideoxygalactose transaminase
MSWNIPFAKVDCSGNELNYVEEVLHSGWLTTAGKAQLLESKFSEYIGATFACAVNSGTAALHLALEAIGIGPGDKVLLPSMTFTATAEVIRYLSADPVFCDVDYSTKLVTPSILKDALLRNPGIKAVMIVHFGGQAADMDAILPICRACGARVIEDAAHAFPSRRNGKWVGTFGDITCFSFYANKTITTGEGGMLVTDEETLFRRCKVMRLHGIDRDIWNRFSGPDSTWEYDVVAPGYKYNMADLNAAVGLAQLERAEIMRRERQRCAMQYFELLRDCPHLDLPGLEVAMEDHSWHLFPVVLRSSASISRNRMIELLSEHGIGTSVHYKPLHRMSYYRERYGLQPEAFPNSERIWQGTFTLPIYPSLKKDEVGYISDTLWAILSGT